MYKQSSAHIPTLIHAQWQTCIKISLSKRFPKKKKKESMEYYFQLGGSMKKEHGHFSQFVSTAK